MMLKRVALAMALLLAVAACGGGSDNADDQGADDTVTPADSVDVGASGDDMADDAAAVDEPAEADAGDTAQDIIDGLDFGDGLARISIGETSYEFALGGNSAVGSTTYLGVCQQLFGLITGGGYDTQGRAITVEFDIPPVDWETYDDGRFDTSTPRIAIEDDESDTGWIADMTLAEFVPEVAGSSQVDEWVSDGTAASGTATFIEVGGAGTPVDGAQPVVGTFELGCAGN